MKKFLLSLACVLGIGAWASAETVTINMAEQYGSATVEATAITVDGVTLTPEQAGASNAPSYNKAGDLRNYANGTVTISADVNIKSISFEISSQGLKRLTTITPSEGEIAEQGANPLVWNGEAKSIVFTVGEKADYGTDGASKAGQFCITSVTVELEGEGSGDVNGEENGENNGDNNGEENGENNGENSGDNNEDNGGTVTPETPALNSIAEFIAKNDTETAYIVNFPLTVGYCTSTNVFVTDGTDFIQIYKKGGSYAYNVGDVIPAGWEATYALYYTTPELIAVDEVPAATAGTFTAKEVEASDVTTDLVNSVVVIKSINFAEATPSSATNFTGTNGSVSLTFRNNYKIESVEAGTYDVLGVINIYSSAVQVYPISYTAVESGDNNGDNNEDDPVVEPTTPSVNSIAEMLETDGSEFIVNIPLTVAFASGTNTYATDGTDFILIYKKNLGFNAGDVIPAGWSATYTLYYSTPEIVPAGDVPAATETAELALAEYEISEVAASLVNHVIVIKNVTFSDATPTSGNFTNAEETLTLRNKFQVASVEAGTYDVTAAVDIYSGAVQVYPISYEAVTTSVSDINVENNAAVEYFNLQGVRVANPENGIFVRRQGNKVSKVVIR